MQITGKGELSLKTLEAKKSPFCPRYNRKTQQFLLKHLGVFKEKLVLAQRLDSN